MRKPMMPTAGRLRTWFILAAALVVVSAASLSDRAANPMSGGVRLTRAVYRWVGVRLPAGLPLDRSSIASFPYGRDALAHIIAWLGVGFLAAWAVRSVRGRLIAWLALFVLSGLIEIGQSTLSTSRAAEPTDLAANGIGLTIGLVVGAVAHWLVTAVRRRFPPRLRHSMP